MIKPSKTFWYITLSVVLACFLIWLLAGILTPFVLSFVLAYFLEPLVEKLVRRKWHRAAAVSLVVGGFIFCIISLFFIFIPIVQTQIVAFSNKIPLYVQNIAEHMRTLVAFFQEKLSYTRFSDISYSTANNAHSILSSLGDVLRGVVNGGLGLFNLLASLVVVPVVVFYLLLDWQPLTNTLYGLIPLRWQDNVKKNIAEINTTLSAFIRGQLTVCLILALFYALSLSVIGLELGALIGLLIGILSFIPYFGFITGVLLSILLALSQGAAWGLWVALAIVFAMGQVLESYILTPHLVGKNVGLHPVWIIFILIAGGYLFGFLGILLAVPVSAVARLFILKAVASYRDSSFYKQKK